MNIFALDENPYVAARFHTDKHVVKMILETAQLLSTAHHILGSGNDRIYKKTHTNHPCAKWVRDSASNYLWTYQLFLALLQEFEYRYDKQHLSARLIDDLARLPANIKHVGSTPFAQAMPDEFKSDDGVTAYRNYYNGAKRHLFGWKKRNIPSFITGVAG